MAIIVRDIIRNSGGRNLTLKGFNDVTNQVETRENFDVWKRPMFWPPGQAWPPTAGMSMADWPVKESVRVPANIPPDDPFPGINQAVTGSAGRLVLRQNANTTIAGKLNGIDFTLSGFDPLTLDFSQPATGQILSQLTPAAIAPTDVTVDAYLTGAGGTASMIQRFKRVANATTITGWGINQTNWWMSCRGHLFIGGKNYEVKGTAAGGVATVVITLLD